MPNALTRQSNGYLREHADKPADWLPWLDEALQQVLAGLCWHEAANGRNCRQGRIEAFAGAGFREFQLGAPRADIDALLRLIDE